MSLFLLPRAEKSREEDPSCYEVRVKRGLEKADNIAIPNNEYYEYYGPDYELNVRASNMTDHNTPEYLGKLKEAVFEILRDKNAAPSVPLQGQLPLT